jgi:hypothetical protein
MITMGQKAAAKMAVRPRIEYTAADNEIISAVARVRYPNNI